MNDLLSLTPFQLSIQAASMQVASLYKEAYNRDRYSDETKQLLEAYISLRRALPKGDDGKHVGSELTQGLING